MVKLKKVLLVDDDDTTNLYNEYVLNKFDATHHIDIVKNGVDALQYLEDEQEAPDLILLDLNMPVMNGLEFMESYQNLPQEKKAKMVVVMLTTSIASQDVNKAKEYKDLAAYKNKPLSEESLREILDGYFGAS